MAKDLSRSLTKKTEMAYNLMKGWSALHVMREMQIKTTRYHYKPLKWPKPGTRTKPNAG